MSFLIPVAALFAIAVAVVLFVALTARDCRTDKKRRLDLAARRVEEQ